jgi:hypothetical protein
MAIKKEDAIKLLWERGVLTWKLDSCQKKLYQTFMDAVYDKVVFNCSRRIGKSTTLVVIALQYAYQKPGSQIKYAAPTARMVRKIVEPTLKMLLADCPEYLKPKLDKHEGVYKFPNGSALYIEGCSDGNEENLRGTSMDLGLIDEAAFIPNLQYLIDDILIPQTLTTDGKMIIASTPPKRLDHDFIDCIDEAVLNNSYIKRTIVDYLEDVKNDPPFFKNRIPAAKVEKIKKAKGENSTTWRREYMCEIIKDSSDAIIPEFNEDLASQIVKDVEMASQYDSYTSLDLGWEDNHAALFGYYDFKSARLIIVDEILVKGKDTNTQSLTEAIKIKESILWRDPISNEPIEPYMRVADDDMITIGDMQQLHGITFQPTRKDNKEAVVNEARIKLASHQILISPKCVKLIHQLKTGTWNKNRKSFNRRNDGHYDLVDAFIYMVRNIHWNKNPYKNPRLYESSWKEAKTSSLMQSAEALKQLFRLKNNK